MKIYKNYYNINFVFDNITISYQKASVFIDKCRNGTLEKNHILSNNPKISAIIPVYNARKYILRALRSIQNQNMEDIEIILVDDCSKDNSLTYIEELQREDPRIKIIKNQKNMGSLYSRSIGALSAKGKYIFSLDNDDMFLDYDIFTTIYNIIKKDGFDILEFKGIRIGNDFNSNRIGEAYFSHHNNFIFFQPELGRFPMNISYDKNFLGLRDNYLWNKCIKTNIYQKALKLFGEKRYKRYMTMHEDFIIVVILFNVADSFRYIQKYGYLNIIRFGSSASIHVDIKLFEMYIIDAALDFSKNSFENKKSISQFMLFLINRPNFRDTLNNSIDNKKLFVSILDRIYSCKYITKEDKEQIKKNITNYNYLNN